MSDTASAWRPTATLQRLRQRAALLAQVRQFFAERQVLEVETPLLSQATVTDPHLLSLQTRCRYPGRATPAALYLQTSPEFAMKRLLASGSGCIYQLCKAFREDEAGRLHNPEFTLLEWYRVGFDHHQLMTEVDALLQQVLQTPPALAVTYAEAFAAALNINPHQVTLETLHALVSQHVPSVSPALLTDKTVALQCLMTDVVEPQLARETRPVFVYDYPASQAALAKLSMHETGILVAERFEVFYRGIELANGYHELTDAEEQAARFARDLAERAALARPIVPTDQHLLAALSEGLPACAGVALGFDRLMMLATQASTLAECVAFPITRA